VRGQGRKKLLDTGLHLGGRDPGGFLLPISSYLFVSFGPLAVSAHPFIFLGKIPMGHHDLKQNSSHKFAIILLERSME
jgi:hypothetical protein